MVHVSAARLVLDSALEVQMLGDNMYKTYQEWKDIPGKMKHLQEKLQFWEQLLGQPGDREDMARLLKRMDIAKEELKTEEDRLSAKSSRCRFIATRVAFPSQVGQSLQYAFDAFDEILKTLREEDQAHILSGKRALRRPFAPKLNRDKLYVPLQETENDLCKALEDTSSPTLALLYGAAGSGKTLVARQMCVHYHQNSRFSQATFLECGPSVDTSKKVVELLHKLGFQLGDIGENTFQNRKLLYSRLRKDKSTLIILDDVRDGELVKIILEGCNTKVKCLVTSRELSLFKRFDKTDIKMQDILPDDAQKILAIHGGFSDHLMPGNLEVEFEKLIKVTNSHPWALATVATCIDKDRKDDRQEWNAAIEDVLHYMKSKEVSNDSKVYWPTMCSLVESLSPDAQRLLVLLYAFEELSVCEEIIMLLYESIKGHAFSLVKQELVKKGWLRIGKGKTHHYDWSLQSLPKIFIQEAMKDTVQCVLNLLLCVEVDESNCQGTISSITAAVFFDTCLAEQLVADFHIPLDTLRQRRHCVRILILGLFHPAKQEKNAGAKKAAKEVLKHYLHSGQLDEIAVSQLLATSTTASRVMDVLRTIACESWRGPLNVQMANPQGLALILLDILLERPKVDLLNVYFVLIFLFKNDGDLSRVFSCPHVIGRIIQVLTLENDSSCLGSKRIVLRFLRKGTRRCAKVLVENSRLLQVLAKLCEVDVQYHFDLVLLFDELAGNKDLRTTLSGTPGLIDSLGSLATRASIRDDHSLTTTTTYRARRGVKLCLIREFLNDLDNAEMLGHGYSSSKYPWESRLWSLWRAEEGDCEGALLCLNECIERGDREDHQKLPFYLQERGVLKRLMGDWDGDLAYVTEYLDKDMDDYELLKRRGYVKFLMGIEDRACTDPERAIECEPSDVDDPGYDDPPFFGGYSNEFMDFKKKNLIDSSVRK